MALDGSAAEVMGAKLNLALTMKLRQDNEVIRLLVSPGQCNHENGRLNANERTDLPAPLTCRPARKE
jgi:hypothetical protein